MSDLPLKKSENLKKKEEISKVPYRSMSIKQRQQLKSYLTIYKNGNKTN